MSSMKVMNPRVKWFVKQMQKKLRMNTEKNDSRLLEYETLLNYLQCEVDEMFRALEDYRKHRISKYWETALVEECADVANFAMMIADKANQELME